MLLDPKYHTRPLRFFLRTNKQEVPWMILNGFFYACAQGSMLAATYLLGMIIDRLGIPGHAPLFPFLLATVLLIGGYEIGFRIGHIIEVLMLSRIRNRIKKALFDHTTSLSFGYFTDRFAGEISHKVSQITDAYERLVIITTNELIEGGALTIVSAIVLGLISPYLGFYILLWGVIFVVGIIPLGARMQLRASAFAGQEAKTTGTFVDLYSNISAFKVYGRAANRQTAHIQIDAEMRAYRRLGLWSIFTYAYEGWSIIFLGAGLLIIVSLLYMQGAVSIGTILFITAVALRLFSFAWDVGRNTLEFIRHRGEVSQNLEDLVVAPTVLDGSHEHTETPTHVDVAYRDVTFGYTDERPVLSGFSIDVQAGQKVGIVGLSGAGKTTFANLLLRFFDVQEGAITINGKDVRDFTQEFLRSHISYISQETSLFHTSIAENIAYGSAAASSDEIEKAAKFAYAHDFITGLPRGYGSIVGERGIKLSGGQRQRIAIARAILANRPLFLFDEATSALDSDSERKIQKALETLMEGKTVIAIAHRLSTLAHMDRIIYLEEGKIVEDGTHEELLALNGRYAQLWHMQAGGFLPDTLPTE